MKSMNEFVINRLAESEDSFDEGMSLWETDGVLQSVVTELGDGTCRIESEVEGSDMRIYKAAAVIAPWEPEVDGIILEAACSCGARWKDRGLCRHLVAMLLEYDYRAEQGMDDGQFWEEDGNEYWESEDGLYRIASESSGTDSECRMMPDTDSALRNLMNFYVLQDRNQFCQEHGNGDVRLEPTLHLEQNRESMDLKIGITQMYVVKDIRELISNIKEMNYVKYGKRLAFNHSQSAFTRESTGIVNLLFELDIENEDSFQYNGYGYGNAQMRRSCTLTPSMFDKLMEIYEGRKLKVDDQITHKEQEVPVVRENPRLPLRISSTGESGGATVEMDSVFTTEGSRQCYILWNDRFYICTKEYFEQAKGFLKLMTTNRQKQAYLCYYGYFLGSERAKENLSYHLSEKDYAAFSLNTLPVVRNLFDVEIKDVDFSKYEPAEAVFRSYLDKVGDHIECRASVLYGDKEYNVARIATKEQADRDIRQEFQVRTILETYFHTSEDGQTYVSDGEEQMLDFLEGGIHELEKVSDIFATDRFKNMRVIPMPAVSTGISIKGNLLDISWDVEGMSPQEVMDTLADYKKKKKYHRLKNGDFLRMDENSVAVLSELCGGLHLTKEQLKARRAELPLYRSLYLDALMKENAEVIRVERDRSFKTIVRDMRSAEDSDFELPKTICAQLRPYQEIGFQWLCTLAKYGFGGILADDMGLGKTLQVLCFLAANPGSRTLVVCPASLVYNWESECQRFYPSARVMAVAGSAAGRQAQIADWEQADILVTSYDLLKRDIDFYENKQFDCCVIDEAQYIKNASTQAAKAVKSISCRCRFALTGTPVENRLGELWSIFEFLMPDYLFSYKRFKEELESPITESRDEAARIRLSRMVKPFILRRLKKDVLKELPDKVEEIVYARMEGEQRKLYLAREKQLLMMLNSQSEEEFKTQKLQILAELTGLRQICCDPALVYDNFTAESAKTSTCLDVVENAVSGGHRILLFSQFASMLVRLHAKLEERGIGTFLLTGKTGREERRRLVERFQRGEADVFLISLKAGGTGLNLTAADMVIHYDPWWNLAAQNQATDRAYRIGQDNKVTVIRLIVKESIEERILKMQEDKQNLADSIISEDGVSMSGLDREQLLSVLEETGDRSS